MSDNRKAKIERNRNVLVGIPASPGKAEGLVKVVRGEEDLQSLLSEADSSKYIVVVPVATPEIAKAIHRIKGIVSEVGGVTSHAGTLAREFGIPCITGVENATKIFRNGMRVIIDGDEGKIRIAEGEITSLQKSSSQLLSRESITQNSLRDLKACLEIDEFKLSAMGKRVVRTPGFLEEWKEFVTSLSLEDLRDMWREDLGKLLAFLVNMSTTSPSLETLRSLVELHNNFYRYDLLATCLEPYLYSEFRKILEEQKVPPSVIEKYARKYGIPFKELWNALQLPIPQQYLPMAMLFPRGSLKPLLVRLGKLYSSSKEEYHRLLSSIETGALFRKQPHPQTIAYEIISTILPQDKKEKFRKYAELLAFLGMVDDMNRLIGREFAEDVKNIVDILSPQYGIPTSAQWPWERLLELYQQLYEKGIIK
jgi:phosphohistidine swiveling domain-containing protein